MKITDKSDENAFRFENLELEDIFKFDGRLFMKVAYSEINAYDFSKSRLTEISADTVVEYIPSELILHGKYWNIKKES